jgi:hypothetical protein
MKRLILLTLTLLLLAAPGFAEAAADAAGPAGKNLTVRTFQLKHKDADKAAAVIKGLMSPEGSMSIQPATNALVVTDAAANLKKIAAAIAEFDAPPRPYNLTIRLVSAGKVAADAAHVDDGLGDVAPKLALLRYNSLQRVGAVDVVGREGEPGLVDLNGYRAEFKFGEYDSESDSMKLTDFRLSRLEGDQLTQMLKTTLNLKLGQTVVVGATRQPQSQRALMIVISATR